MAILDNPGPDPTTVAGRCADWIVFQAARVTDGPATFRTFMERAAREQPPQAEPVGGGAAFGSDLAVYDRFVN